MRVLGSEGWYDRGKEILDDDGFLIRGRRGGRKGVEE